MTEQEAHVAFNLLPDVGAVGVAKRVARFGSAVAAWEHERDPRDWEGKVPAWEREIELARKLHVTLVTLLDEAYPPLLRTIPSPPLVLYVTGDVRALACRGIAVVGTRHPSTYGLMTAKRFATGLAEARWGVFSGLALGIDAAAHQGALLGHGVTVGVLGGALDRFYPKANRELARKIVGEGGAVISEFPFGRLPDVRTFPQRNRIVAGLTCGTLAIEAPLMSGTLITCRLAAEQGRAVMAVPGHVDCPNAQGCHALIREGAQLVTSVEDIIEAVTPVHAPAPPPPRKAPADIPRPSAAPPPPRKTPAGGMSDPAASVSAEEAAILRVLSEEGMTIDALVSAVKQPAARVNTLLVQLRLKKRARFLPGNRVRRMTAGEA